MTVQQMVEKLGLSIKAGRAAALGREITGVYIGDLLSRVIGRAPCGSAWVTIIPHLNVAAAALLADVSCVILAEGVEPQGDLTAKCREEGIALLSAAEDAATLAYRIQSIE